MRSAGNIQITAIHFMSQTPFRLEVSLNRDTQYSPTVAEIPARPVGNVTKTCAQIKPKEATYASFMNMYSPPVFFNVPASSQNHSAPKVKIVPYIIHTGKAKPMLLALQLTYVKQKRQIRIKCRTHNSAPGAAQCFSSVLSRSSEREALSILIVPTRSSFADRSKKRSRLIRYH